ncbi:hypothetical protein G7K71_08090 [Desulfofundulus sp. TPOSR]|uniref:hypothetical protein n=1 Tax=Desulfofundulus sp. TPOSR TaxID=2714340 RepID=UPI001408007B|nr:hypothetical protein [Desulfofundulus sp. TPOSR]NHM26942.1 hypothetical protein [Desulfofundulus sp. TPOSR]
MQDDHEYNPVTPLLPMFLGLFIGLAATVVSYVVWLVWCIWRAKKLNRQPTGFPEAIKARMRKWGP